jgi:hypothetical protein
MKIWLTFKAPLGVQLNRLAFILYALFFFWPVWKSRHTASVSGTVLLLIMVFFSLLGLFYTSVRALHSKWILAILGILIPAVFWSSMCLLEFSRPEEWWEWPLDLLMVGAWFAIPIALAMILFRDKKSSEYFNHSIN